MFFAPNFGEDDFDIHLNSRNTIPLTHITKEFFLEQTVSPYQTGTNMDLTQQNMNQSAGSDDVPSEQSILDSLDSVAPKFPPQNFDVPDISYSNSTLHTGQQQFRHPVTQSNIFPQPDEPLLTISPTDLSAQLGFQRNKKEPSPVSSSTGSGATLSPNREPSSEDSDDCLPLAQLAVKRHAVEEAPAPAPAPPVTTKKQRTPKKRKKKDPNEPQKPVSAYALFFRDTQAAIKGQNPSASFGEVSKIVASMWEGLDPEHKNVYKKKTEAAKKEYLKQLAAYRASLVSQAAMEESNMRLEKSPTPPQASPLHNSPLHNSPMHNSPLHNSPLRTSPPHMGYMNDMGNGSPQAMMNFNNNHHQAMAQSPLAQSPMAQSPPMNDSRVAQSPPMNRSPLHEMGLDNMPQQNNTQFLQQPMVDMSGHGRILGPGMCVRNGCTNRAIDNIGWDSEYCSNECVVSHCRDVFTAWVASRQGPVNSFQVK